MFLRTGQVFCARTLFGVNTIMFRMVPGYIGLGSRSGRCSLSSHTRIILYTMPFFNILLRRWEDSAQMFCNRTTLDPDRLSITWFSQRCVSNPQFSFRQGSVWTYQFLVSGQIFRKLTFHLKTNSPSFCRMYRSNQSVPVFGN